MRTKFLGTLAALLFAFVPQMRAQEADDLQEYLDQLASRQTESQRMKSPRKGQEIAVPSGLTEVDLSTFSSSENRTKEVTVRTNAKFINGTISAASSYSGGTCLLKVYGGATVVLDATAGVNASVASSANCKAAVGINDGSTFYECGDITAPASGTGIAIYIDGTSDTFNYVSGKLTGSVYNPNGGTVNGLDGPTEAYAVLSTDGTTLSFYYDGKKNSRQGTIYTATQFRTTYDDGWGGSNRSIAKNITTVTFDTSFADYDGVTSTKNWFNLCSSLKTINGLSNLNTSNVTDMTSMFGWCSGLTSLDLSSFNTKNVSNMYIMFGYCSSLKSIDVSSFNTEKVTWMESMFTGCSSLTSLDVSGFNTRNVRDMSDMFNGCSGLSSLDLSGFDMSSATDIEGMFSGCTNLTNLILGNFNTENVKNMGYMFVNCKSLTSLDLSTINTKNATTMYNMFYGCTGLTNLDLSKFNTESLNSMGNMFSGCTGLTNIDLSGFNTEKVQYLMGMFQNCTNLKCVDLSGWNTQNVTSTDANSSAKDYGMFSGCSSLVTIYVGEGWNMSKVTNSSRMFKDCISLVGGDGTKYDPNYTDKTKAYAGIGGYLTMEGQETNADDLQAYIDANAGAGGVVVVDLSKFQSVIREATLNIGTGANYRFINGTMDRAGEFHDAVMLISEGSTVEVGTGAVITGNDHCANKGTIVLNGGTLDVTQGVVEGGIGTPPGIIIIGGESQVPAIQLTSPNDHFCLSNGTIYGGFECDVVGADIRFYGGKIRGMKLRETDEANSPSSSRRKMPPFGRYTPYISTHSDIYIYATTPKDYTWGYLNWGDEEETLDAFDVCLYDKSVIHLQKMYDGGFNITLYDKEADDVVMVGDGYTITQQDLERIKIEEVRYTEGPPYYDRRNSYLKLENNKLHLSYDDLQEYLNSLNDSGDSMYGGGSHWRDFPNTEWQSLYLPFDIDYADWAEKFEVARFEGISFDNGQPVLVATIMESGKTNANTPYLIRAKKIGAVLSVNYSTSNEVVQSVSYSTSNATYTFTGNYEDMTGMHTAQQYRLQGGWLNVPTSDNEYLPKFRWYMTIDGTQPTEAIRGLKVRINHEGDDATAIDETEFDKLPNEKCYDLSGREIPNGSQGKGIYIINNKKYIKR